MSKTSIGYVGAVVATSFAREVDLVESSIMTQRGADGRNAARELCSMGMIPVYGP